MLVKPFITGMIETNCYLIVCPDTRKGMIIDAAPELADVLLKYIESNNITLEGIILTHSHWDHTADAAKIKEATGAKVYASKEDEYRLTEPDKHSIFSLPFKLEPCKPDVYLEDGLIIKCGSIELTALFTPGHTEGGYSFVSYADKYVFCGDSVFCMSVGRTDLPGGDTDTLVNSIKSKLYALDDDFKVLPGHGQSTNIGYEKLNNPFVRDDMFI